MKFTRVGDKFAPMRTKGVQRDRQQSWPDYRHQYRADGRQTLIAQTT